MFSRRDATVLMLIRFSGVTFVLTLLSPHEPQPSVSDGSRWKLNRSPMAPCAAGVLISMRQVFTLDSNMLMARLLLAAVYSTASMLGAR